MTRRQTTLWVVGFAAVLLGGCSAGGSNDASAPAQVENEPGDSATDERGEPVGFTAEHAVIYTGSLALRADDPFAKADEAIAAIEGVDGFVANDNRRSDERGTYATVTLRIPAESFSDALERLAELGEEVSRSIETEDVTQATADIDTAIESKQVSVDRVRELMDDTTTLDEIVSIEEQLTIRESELAALQAAKRAMADAVSYSTITVTISSTTAPEPASDGPDGFGEGLASGWAAFLAVGKTLLTVVGILLPFLIVLSVPVLGLWWYLRRRRAGRPVVATVAPPPVESKNPQW